MLRRALPLLVLAAIALLFAAGAAARQQIDVELSLDAVAGLREWVLSFGWRAPAVFVGLVTFRTFLFLPSGAVLLLGGLAFGAVPGAGLGALGLVSSAALQFAAARVFGDDWVKPRLGARGRVLEERITRAGAWVVALMTAHPAGAMTPTNLAAGLSSMSAFAFSSAVLLAAPVRAGSYSLLGSSLLDWGPGTSIVVALGLAALALLPLLHPRVRRWVVDGTREAALSLGAGARDPGSGPGTDRAA